MSITFTITCDTETELAYVLENLHLELNGKMPKIKKGKKPSASVKTSAGDNTTTKTTKTKRKTKKTQSRQAGLTPLLREELDKVIATSKPFRSKDVIERVMKKHKDLNERSVTTGVNKLLSDSNLKFETIKNPVGRSYKQYMPAS